MAQAKILSGTLVAEAINSSSVQEIEQLKKMAISPSLVIVRVGDLEDAIAYERSAIKRAQAIGIATRSLALPESVSEITLCLCIDGLNRDNNVHGVLILRPLPAHINDDHVRNALSPSKDIDGITDISIASVFTGARSGFYPCTPQACLEILDHYGVELAGKRLAVVGRSLVIGRPVAMMLMERDATVSIYHSRSMNLKEQVRQAEIVVACVGQAKMLNADYLSAGQIVIDVGINFNVQGQMLGDVDFANASELVAAITPVPGGVGAVTTAVLMKHVVQAAKRLNGISGS